MKYFLAFFISIVVGGIASGQNSFATIYSDPAATFYGYELVASADGGYASTGFRGSLTLRDVYLMKTDADGTLLWLKTYGSNQDDMGYSLQQTSDGGYIIAGETSGFGQAHPAMYIIKTITTGDTLWTKTFATTPGFARAYSIRQTSDGGFIVTGDVTLANSIVTDVILLKLDANGNRQWCKHIGNGLSDVGNVVRQTADGGYIIAGFANESFGSGKDILLVKTDELGDTIWTKTFSGSLNDIAQALDITPDGGYIVTGFTNSHNAGQNYEGFLLKTNSSGEQEWFRTYGYTRAYSVVSAAGGYTFAGYGPVGSGQYSLIHTDNFGNLNWASLFSDAFAAICYGLCVTPDGGYAMNGYSLGFGVPTGYAKAFFVKTTSAGIAPCTYVDATSYTPDTVISPDLPVMSGLIVNDQAPDSAFGGTVSVPSTTVQNLVCLSTETEDLSPIAAGLALYPNPNDGVFSILSEELRDEQVIITITDIHGNQVYQYSGKVNHNLLISEPGISEGMYFVKITSAKGCLFRKMSLIH